MMKFSLYLAMKVSNLLHLADHCEVARVDQDVPGLVIPRTCRDTNPFSMVVAIGPTNEQTDGIGARISDGEW